MSPIALLSALVVLAVSVVQFQVLRRLHQFGGPADRGSARAMALGWHVVLAAGVLEAAFAPGLWPEPVWAQPAGLALFATGFALRLVAVRTLDRHFSPLVELQPGHALVTHGIYAWVRHPAYVGTACWALSLPLLLGSVAAGAAVFLAFTPALAWRVRVEEAVLAQAFGARWDAYRRAVPPLWPRLGPWRGA